MKTLLLLFPLLLACQAERPADPADPGAPSPAPASSPWTQAFLPAASLVADVILIEGPDDLGAHIAVQEAGAQATLETTTDGLLQILRPAQGNLGQELHAQLDNLTMVAFKRIEILRRPGDVPVRVVARGNAWWALEDGTRERREATIQLVGERGR